MYTSRMNVGRFGEGQRDFADAHAADVDRAVEVLREVGVDRLAPDVELAVVGDVERGAGDGVAAVNRDQAQVLPVVGGDARIGRAEIHADDHLTSCVPFEFRSLIG